MAEHLQAGTWSPLTNAALDALPVMKHREAALACLIALTIIGRWQGDKRSKKIGHGELARLSGLSKAGVRVGLDSLEEQGLIIRLRHGGGRRLDVAEWAIRFQKCYHGNTSQGENCHHGDTSRPGSATTVRENCHHGNTSGAEKCYHGSREGIGKEYPQEILRSDSSPGCARVELFRSDSSGHAGIRASTRLKLAGLLGIKEPRGDDKSQVAKQALGDKTCLRQIVDLVVTADDESAAREQADRLITLGRELQHRQRRRMPGFMAEAKERWPAVAARYSGKNGQAVKEA